MGRMGLLNKEEEAAKQTNKPKEQQQPIIQEERFEQNKMEVEFSHQQQHVQQQQHAQQQHVEQHVQQQQHVQQHVQQQQHVEQQQQQHIHLEENGDLDEEDSCPPDLESVEPVVSQNQQVEINQQQRTTAQQDFLNLDTDSELLRNLAIAIKAGMEVYQGEGTYEPSADELIDVLKNLENLAAANPALYRAIVDQIKVCHTKSEGPKQRFVGNQPMHDPRYEGEQTNGHHESEAHMEQGYSDEVDRHEQEMYHQEQLQQEQQLNKMNGEPEMAETEPRIPTFLGKPEIISMGGEVIRLIVRFKASSKCDCCWYHNDNFVSESNTTQIFHDKIALNSYQFGLEIYEPSSKSAGLYKCMVKNDHGQLQVNLNLNIEPDGQVAGSIKTSEAPQATKKIEKKRVKVHVEDQGPQLSEEELKQMEREAKLQAEADREVEAHKAQLREKKRKEKEPPPPPKTITVMAGSRNKPAWPIAPGIANANQPRQITLISGEDEAES